MDSDLRKTEWEWRLVSALLYLAFSRVVLSTRPIASTRYVKEDGTVPFLVDSGALDDYPRSCDSSRWVELNASTDTSCIDLTMNNKDANPVRGNAGEPTRKPKC